MSDLTRSEEIRQALAVPSLNLLPPVVMVQRGQAVLPDVIGLDEGQWLIVIAEISARLNDAQFFFGDLLNKGVRQFGEDAFDKAAAIAGRCRKTLVDYARVANNVPKESRRNDLSFNHHRQVEHLDSAGQLYFLDEAAEKNWSVAELRAAVRAALKKSPKSNGLHNFCIGLADDDSDVLCILAEKEGMTPAELLHRIVTDYLEAESPSNGKVDWITAPALRKAADEQPREWKPGENAKRAQSA